MNNRPLLLKGKIYIRNRDNYIIGKIIKNKRTNNDKERYIQVLDNNNIDLYEEGYLGYIFQDKPENINLDNINYCYKIMNYDTLIDFDVVEIIDGKFIKVLYRDDSEDNAIVVTNQCNSNCIMCPDSDEVRNIRFNPDIQKLLKQVECIPDDTKHLTITGGEPGLLKENLVTLLKKCKECLNDTEFLLLSNGKVFADNVYSNMIAEVAPEYFRVAIPIYSDNEKIHDEITRTYKSFKQAVLGIRNLLNDNVDIEIRIVVLKKNYKQLEKIAKFIIREFPEIKMVNIMALEMARKCI